MVNIPEPQINPNVVSKAPTSPISPHDIAAPHQLLAQTMDAWGDDLNKVAVQAAEVAGQNAVTRDPSGRLVIQPVPMFGDAGAAYSRAAHQTYLNMARPEIETALTQLRIDHPDPKDFGEALKGYHAEALKNAPPGLAPSLNAVIASEGQQQLRGAMVADDRLNTINALESSKAQILTLQDKMTSLARQGGTDTDEYRSAERDLRAIYDGLNADPRFKYPRERAELELKEHLDESWAQGQIGEVVRKYGNKQNSVAAKNDMIDRLLTGKGVEERLIPINKRISYVNQAIAQLEGMSATDKAAIAENEKVINTYTDDLHKNPNSFSMNVFQDHVQRSAAMGDTKGLDKLRNAYDYLPVHRLAAGQDLANSKVMLRDIRNGYYPTPIGTPTKNFTGEVNSGIDRAAAQTGMSPELMRVFANRESSGNPRANAHAPTQYKGLMQLNQKEFQKYVPGGNIYDAYDNALAAARKMKVEGDNFAQEFGRQPTDTERYLMHNQGEGGARNHIRNPNELAWVNMLNTGEGQQRGEAWAKKTIVGNLPDRFKGAALTMTSQDFMDIWHNRIEGNDAQKITKEGKIPYQASNVYAAHEMQIAEHTIRENIAAGVDKRVADTVKLLTETDKKLGPTEMRSILEDIYAVGGTHYHNVDKLVQAATSRDVTDGVIKAGQESAAGVNIRQQFDAIVHGGQDPIQRNILENASKAVERKEKDLAEHPLKYGADRQLYSPPNKIDINDTAGVTQEIMRRQKNANILRQSEKGVGPINLLDLDSEEVKQQLIQGDPKKAGAFLEAIAKNSSPEDFKATMYSKPMKEALDGMAHTYDPQRLEAGMAVMHKMFKDDAPLFKQKFGDTETRLQIFQTYKDSGMGLDWIVEKMKDNDLPREAEARKKRMEVASDELKGVLGKDIASGMAQKGLVGTIAGWTPGSLARVTGLDYRSPADTGVKNFKDNLQEEMFVGDFSRFYKEYRAQGLDAGRAKKAATETLTSTWGYSHINGTLMQHNPENIYPMVDGKHDYIKDQISDAIDKADKSVREPTMPEMGAMEATGVAGQVERPKPSGNLSFEALVPDDRTATDIFNGKLPRYNVVVYNKKTDSYDLLRDENGNTGFYFDPAEAQAKHEARFRSIQKSTLDTQMKRDPEFEVKMSQFADFPGNEEGATSSSDDDWAPTPDGPAEKLLKAKLHELVKIEDRRKLNGKGDRLDRFSMTEEERALTKAFRERGQDESSDRLSRDAGIEDIKDTEDELTKELNAMSKTKH